MYNASNNAETILSTSIDSSATELTVADASLFPDVDFVITIEDEIMEVTDVTGNVFTVVRGHESTSVSGHLAGVAVEHRWTAGMHTELVDVINGNAAEVLANYSKVLNRGYGAGGIIIRTLNTRSLYILFTGASSASQGIYLISSDATTVYSTAIKTGFGITVNITNLDLKVSSTYSVAYSLLELYKD